LTQDDLQKAFGVLFQSCAPSALGFTKLDSAFLALLGGELRHGPLHKDNRAKIQVERSFCRMQLTFDRCQPRRVSVVPLVFSSRLNSDRRDELESLMFFHPEQNQHLSSINASIRSYGFPKIVDENGALRIGIEGLEVQTLYAFVDRGNKQDLAGVLVYTRVHDDTLVLLHMAVRPEFCYSIGYKNELVLARILAQLRAIAKRINGIKKLSILYADKEVPRALI
jgi:hypothetical protein